MRVSLPEIHLGPDDPEPECEPDAEHEGEHVFGMEEGETDPAPDRLCQCGAWRYSGAPGMDLSGGADDLARRALDLRERARAAREPRPPRVDTSTWDTSTWVERT